MVDYRPYHLLLRLGLILVPILAGVVGWAYYHPSASMLTSKLPAVIPALATAKPPNPAELAAEPVAAPAGNAATVAMPPAGAKPAVSVGPGGRETGTARSFAPETPAAAPGGGVASATATTPALPGARQQPAPGREHPKARNARKHEASATRRTTEKLDKEINRKLNICRGCWAKHGLSVVIAGLDPAIRSVVRRVTRHPAKRGVALRAPAGVSHASTQSGRQLAVRADGTAEVSAEDAQPLIAAGWSTICQ